MRTYEPKVLYNPKKETVEFMVDGRVYIFQPGEKKILDGFIAYHALVETNTGLVEYGRDDQGNVPTTVGSIAYERMGWRDLLALAGERGIQTVGKKRDEVTNLLVALDEQEAGAL